MSEQESKQSEPEVDAGWEAEDHSDSGKHVLAIGSIDAAAHGPCTCGCGVGPSWSLEVHADDGDWQAASFEDAQRKAERALRQMRDDLNQHFGPLLRWDSGEAKLLDCWRLRVWQWRDGSWVWSLWFLETQADGAYDVPSESDGRRAAEAALRSRGVVFRVEQNSGAT